MLTSNNIRPFFKERGNAQHAHLLVFKPDEHITKENVIDLLAYVRKGLFVIFSLQLCIVCSKPNALLHLL
jgi:hypothetical protein